MKRKFARRCRGLMLVAGSAEAREQLRLWAEELDEQAEVLDRQLAAREESQFNPLPRRPGEREG